MKVYFDNERLIIIRERERQAYDTCYLSATLRPDWDVMEEINARYKRLGIDAKYVWVRGHQDDNKAEDELPVPARYNVIAANLTEKRNTGSIGRKSNKRTLMLPGA